MDIKTLKNLSGPNCCCVAEVWGFFPCYYAKVFVICIANKDRKQFKSIVKSKVVQLVQID